MAFRLTCDVAACGAEIDSGVSGCPALTARNRTYCKRCQACADAVEVEVRRQGTILALKAQGEIDALRERLMGEMLPAQLSPLTERKGVGEWANWTIHDQ